MDGDVSINMGSSDPYHGTKVAGCAAAGNNGIGISSIGFDSKLWLYRTTSLTKIQEAAADEVDIINLSFGAPSDIT